MSRYENLQEFLSATQARPVRGGEYYLATCPFHDDRSPSLLIFPSENRYICLAAGCGKRGTLSDLILSPLSPPVSHPEPGGRRAIRLPTGHREMQAAYLRLLQEPEALAYLARRGMDRVIERLPLGVWKDYIIIPITESFSAARRFRGKGPRFLYSEGSRAQCQKLLGEIRIPVFIAFGIFDALSIYELGYSVLLHPKGCNLHATDIPGDFFYVVIPDRGEEANARRLAAEIEREKKAIIAKVVIPDYGDAKDPNDLLIRGSLALILENARRELCGNR